MLFTPYSLSENIIKKIIKQTKLIAKKLKVIGLLNIQFAVKYENKVNYYIYWKLIQEPEEQYHL